MHYAHHEQYCHHGSCIDHDTMSSSTLFIIGVAIIAISMMIAIALVSVHDARRARFVLSRDDEEKQLLLDQEEPLPPYEPPPPAYVAELECADSAVSCIPASVEFAEVYEKPA